MSSVRRSYEEINEKIARGEAVVVTAEEVIDMVDKNGIEETAKRVDVVTTGTFSPMCSSGAFLNFGHADPPIKMARVWLNDVPAYTGIAAVDAYIGATERSENDNEYGGAHVIEDLVSKRKVRLRSVGSVTDCYPRKEVDGYIDIDSLNEAFLFNPRNAYQNYAAVTNSTGRTLYTYMGVLLPKFGNITYATSGELSPLLNDPELRTIGVGTRIFLGGAVGYVAWNGTQHSPSEERTDRGIPVGPASTISVIGNLKEMSAEFIKAAYFKGYGPTLFVGIGVPIPILDEEMLRFVSVRDEDIKTVLIDFGVQRRDRPVLKVVTYGELKMGFVEMKGRKIPTAPISSMYKARQIAYLLKKWIQSGKFFVQRPVAPLPKEGRVKPMVLKEA